MLNETLIGAGGGGSSDSDFVQKPDNLRSSDVFEGVLGLCSGPIKGPVDGLKSIRLNGTPIVDASGTLNFGQGFLATFADGDPLKFPQKALLRLGSAGAPENINVQLRNHSSVGNPWVSRTVSALGAEFIDLRFVVQQLYKQGEDGIFEHTMNLEIQMKPVGKTNWTNPLTNNATVPPAPSGSGSKMINTIVYYIAGEEYGTESGGGYSTLRITGKTTSPYVKELRVKVPNTGAYENVAWDIRCRLVEAETVDDDPDFEKRIVNWESATAVFTSTMGEHEDWRGLAWLQVYGEASTNFTGIPDVDGEYFCKVVSVPPSTVYNPDTRQYTGTVWNGSWAKAYTNDPAWIINDVLTDSISGMATFVPGAHLNKWDALELSKWCSELVSDGNGGQHPRFSMNLFVDQPQKTDDFIRYLAGACSATAWDNGGGEWRCKIDRAQTPVAVFTQENIEGEFIYSHTDIDTRFNDVTVVFLNEEFDYREDRLRIKDDAHIAKFGRKPTKVVGIGITNYQQALRWAVLRLRTNINEKRAVSFTTNRQGKLLERFDWILIADASLNVDGTTANRLSSGRIIQNKGGSVVVRDPVRLEVGVAYKLKLSVPNPNYNPEPTTGSFHADYQLPTIVIERNITNSAAQRGEEVRELFIDSPLPANTAENINVALEAVGLPAIPKAYRVTDVDYAEDGERVNINAMEIDTAKWAASDRGDYSYEFPRGTPGPGGTGSARLGKPTAPVGGMWTLTTYASSFEGTRYTLIANWDPPASSAQVTFAKYKLRYRAQGGAWQDLGFTTDDFFELQDPKTGRHELEITAYDTNGRAGGKLRDTYRISTSPRAVSIGQGPAKITGNYDSSGTVKQDLPKTTIYKLVSNGKDVEAVWEYRVTDGGVNGFTPTSGWKPMTAESTAGLFVLNSVEVPDSVVEIKGRYRAMSASISVSIDKLFAGVDNTGDPGGAPVTTLQQTSGFTSIPTPGTSFTPISQEFNLTVGSGQTAKAIIALTAGMSSGYSNYGPWNIEYKLQRQISGTWTDIGGVQNSSPDPYVYEEWYEPYYPGTGPIP